MKKKPELKKVLTIILGVGVVTSIGFNIWLYNKFTSTNQDAKDIQAKVSSIQKEYDKLSEKIKEGKEDLSSLQKKNSELNQVVSQSQNQANTNKIQQEKKAVKSQTTPSKTETTTKLNQSSKASSTPPSKPANTGKVTAADKNGNGIDDEFEGGLVTGGTTTSDPDFQLGTVGDN